MEPTKFIVLFALFSYSVSASTFPQGFPLYGTLLPITRETSLFPYREMLPHDTETASLAWYMIHQMRETSKEVAHLRKLLAATTADLATKSANLETVTSDLAGVKAIVNAPPVHFYVQRRSNFAAKNVDIPFNVERLNAGGAMNTTSGIFTAPRKGIYFFSFSGIQIGPNFIVAGLYVNGNLIGSGDAKGVSLSERHTFSLQSTLQLNVEDKVSVRIYDGNGNLADDGRNFTHFTGYLLRTL